MFKKVLGALADGPFTAVLFRHPQGTWDFMTYAAMKGPLLLKIHGNPYQVDGDSLARAVEHGLHKGVRGRTVHFTTDPEKAPHHSYHVQVAFDVPKSFDFHALAKGEEPELVDHGDSVKVLAIFCNNDQVLAAVRGSLAKEEEPGGKAFEKWFLSVGRGLFVKK